MTNDHSENIRKFALCAFKQDAEVALELVRSFLIYPDWMSDFAKYSMCCSVLTASNGRIDKLIEYIELANIDYRDVLYENGANGINNPIRFVEDAISIGECQ